MKNLDISSKFLTIDNLNQTLHLLKEQNKKIVFTNGCFDILHKGHVYYLNESAKLGEVLIVGLNSDASVKRLGKGDNRPVNDEQARAYVLSALSSVDFVIIFDEDTPFELIEKIHPSVLVKGGDYDKNERDATSKKYIVGANETLIRGGSVKTINIVEGFSTTGLINKMKN